MIPKFVRVLSVSSLALVAAASLAAASQADAAPRKKAPAVKALPYTETAAQLRDKALQGTIA